MASADGSLVTSVGCIIGTNGYIWIYQPEKNPNPAITIPEIKPVAKEVRVQMSILRNAIVALEKAQLPIFRETIQKAMDGALGVEPS